jgi:hypothetical protein
VLSVPELEETWNAEEVRTYFINVPYFLFWYKSDFLNIYKTTRCYKPEDRNLNIHYIENLKSRKHIFCIFNHVKFEFLDTKN